MIGRVLGNRYEIIEKIGGGGMALVYKAQCRLLNRFVAVKILRSEFTEDEEFVKKFKRESQAAASLSHPNIVGIYDVGMEDNIYYIVMEYIKGQTLKDLIKQKGSLGVDHATNIAIQISSALEHAHKNHIVHRDIKSHNIMIKEDNSVKVTDFGIARAVSSSTITNTGNVIGSVHYFSPEQARGGYTDEKSDIYSLGIVMYEMMTGRLPFEGESPIAVALKHLQEDAVKPSTINPRIPKSIDDIILKCMDKDVNNRYSSMSEIMSDLKQSLVMPNGDFVKKTRFIDENTRVIKPIKFDEDPIDTSARSRNVFEESSAHDVAVTELPEKQKKKRSTKMTIFAILGGLILALAVGGIVLGLTSFFSVKEAVVPDLTNLTEEQARQKLKDVGLQMEVADTVPNKDVPAGQIIMQEPKANQKNKVINPVRVTISKGPRKVVVPNLIGESYERVDLLLEKEGLAEGELTQEYSDYPQGVVIKQSIQAGTSVDEGQKVDYVISIGPESFLMPNYVGKNIDEVTTDLIEKDLIKGNITNESSSVYAKNTIISQNITPGTEVNRKSVVDFVVSSGSEGSVKNSSAILQISLPTGKDRMKVTVQKIQNSIIETVYEAYHSSSDSPINVPITGQGKALFEIYVDGSLNGSKEYDFK